MNVAGTATIPSELSGDPGLFPNNKNYNNYTVGLVNEDVFRDMVLGIYNMKNATNHSSLINKVPTSND
jgi:hypothetical protein